MHIGRETTPMSSAANRMVFRTQVMVYPVATSRYKYSVEAVRNKYLSRIITRM